jgi:hypothetical protein
MRVQVSIEYNNQLEVSKVPDSSFSTASRKKSSRDESRLQDPPVLTRIHRLERNPGCTTLAKQHLAGISTTTCQKDGERLSITKYLILEVTLIVSRTGTSTFSRPS